MTGYTNCRNPVLPSDVYVADPEAHVMPDGRVYVYGSLDKNNDRYCSREYRVFSSADMATWIDHGISFCSEAVPWVNSGKAKKYPIIDFGFQNPASFVRDILNALPLWKHFPSPLQKVEQKILDACFDVRGFVKEKDVLFAPDVIHKDGKYYLYFCLADYSEGVAVADRPEGPFRMATQLSCAGIDPAVFVDDDGQAYYYWGQFRACGAKLKPGMIELDMCSVVKNLLTEEEHGFHEGSSVRKRNGIYYFVYSSIVRGKPTCLCYATGSHPLGPFTYGGVIIDNGSCDPDSWNIHGSIEEVNGQWYVFYHRSSQSSHYMRRMCVERISFREDGMIDEVKPTSQGAGAPFAINEKLEGYRACQLTGGVYIRHRALCGIRKQDSVVFRYVQWDKDVTGIVVEAEGSGRMELSVNGGRIGFVVIRQGWVRQAQVHGKPGLWELTLSFSESEDLTLHSVTFK